MFTVLVAEGAYEHMSESGPVFYLKRKCSSLVNRCLHLPRGKTYFSEKLE